MQKVCCFIALTLLVKLEILKTEIKLHGNLKSGRTRGNDSVSHPSGLPYVVTSTEIINIGKSCYALPDH